MICKLLRTKEISLSKKMYFICNRETNVESGRYLSQKVSTQFFYCSTIKYYITRLVKKYQDVTNKNNLELFLNPNEMIYFLNFKC